LFGIIATIILFGIVGLLLIFSDEGIGGIFPIFLILIFFTTLFGTHRSVFALLENRKVSYMLDYATYQKHKSDIEVLARIDFDKLDFDYQQDGFVVVFSPYINLILEVYQVKPHQVQDWEGWKDYYAEDMYFTSFFGLTLKRVLLVATIFYGILLGGITLSLPGKGDGNVFLSWVMQLLPFVGFSSVAAIVLMVGKEVLSITEVVYNSNKSWQVVKMSLFCCIFFIDPTATIRFLQEMG